MSDEMIFAETPTTAQLNEWRSDARHEVERIGIHEFAKRLKVASHALRAFLGGGGATPTLSTALSVYDFDEFPDLKQLMASYFHDSYAEDTGSVENWQSAVDDFVSGESQGRVSGAASDIRRFLSATHTGEEVQQKLLELGCYFAFKRVSLTPRQWIVAVHDRLLSRLDGDLSTPG
jgi:hypothetical protein